MAAHKYRLGKTGDSIVTDGVTPSAYGEEATDFYGGALVAESMDGPMRRRIVALLNWSECFSTEDIEALLEDGICPMHNKKGARLCVLQQRAAVSP